MPDDVSLADAEQRCSAVIQRVSEAVITDERFLETVLTAALARGHVLLEDVPGTGKTLTARTLAQALGLEFNRIQFTPDLLPSDITGSNVYNEQEAAFEFAPGPVFANVVLADEINRAPPKTQAALLEAMEEKQVSVDGDTHALPDPFLVIATQNPVEQEGTFELPEAQRDRFSVKSSIGYPERSGEIELLNRRGARETQIPDVDAAVTPEQVQAMQYVPERVYVDDMVKEYMVDLARATRDHSAVNVGVSPRGIQQFFEAARAHAVINGRDYVAPEDVQAIAIPVLQHRVVLTAEAAVGDTTGATVVETALNSIEVPQITGER